MVVGIQVVDTRAAIARRRADGLGRFQVAASGEDTEPREEPPLGQLQQVIAPDQRRSERLVAGGKVVPTVSTGRLLDRRASSSAEVNRSDRTTASSIASGKPSRRTQMPATAGAVPATSTKPSCATRARVTNSSTAGYMPISSSGGSPSSGGNASGATGSSCSPSSWSGVRLVTSNLSPSADASSADTSSRAATTCSKLSRTISTLRSRSSARSASKTVWPGASRMPSARATVGTTSDGSRSADSATK